MINREIKLKNSQKRVRLIEARLKLPDLTPGIKSQYEKALVKQRLAVKLSRKALSLAGE